VFFLDTYIKSLLIFSAAIDLITREEIHIWVFGD